MAVVFLTIFTDSVCNSHSTCYRTPTQSATTQYKVYTVVNLYVFVNSVDSGLHKIMLLKIWHWCALSPVWVLCVWPGLHGIMLLKYDIDMHSHLFGQVYIELCF